MLAKALITALLFIGGPLLFGCTNKEKSLDRIVVVRVNDSCELTAGALADQLALRLKDFYSLTARSDEVVATTKNSIINDFIVSCLTRHWARENDVFVRRESLDAEIQAVRSQYPDEISFRQSLVAADLSYEAWVDRVQANLLERLVSEKVRERLPQPTEEEIKAHYNSNTEQFSRPAQVRISQIVLGTEDQAKLVEAELKKGKNFEDLAKKFSISPESSEGGDLGWIERGTHEMFDPVFRMGIGQRTRVIQSPFGYHIMKLTARRAAKQLSLKEVRDQVQAQLKAQREQEAYAKWLEAEILRARVYKNDEVVRAIKVFSRSSS